MLHYVPKIFEYITLLFSVFIEREKLIYDPLTLKQNTCTFSELCAQLHDATSLVVQHLLYI